MNDLDWSWLAGIFEGEGTAGLRWAKLRHQGSVKRAYLYVAICQKETSMLLECQRIAGCGKIYPANRKDAKPLYTWYCGCAQARKFLTVLLPFIRSEHKKAQVVNALALDQEMRIVGNARKLECLRQGRITRWSKHASIS